ncbi:MAG TPA: hydrogenase maturation nickel metallochaperone HypA [Dermatophilaceae bacterium]|nr:hydrogenase maturation nickel metallochaperone HypA [Dermatophilaceae bacterium]
MHELALCSSIYEVVDRARGGRVVESVELTVGQLRQVVPETLVACWEVVTAETPLAGSALRIDHVPVTLSCPACGTTTGVTDLLVVACRSCGSRAVRVVRGEEFLVAALEVADG